MFKTILRKYSLVPDIKALAIKYCFDLQPHVASIICKNFNEFFSDGMIKILSKMVITKD